MDNVLKFLNVDYKEHFSYIRLEVENVKHQCNDKLYEDSNCYIMRDHLVNVIGEEYKYNIFKEDCNKCNVIHFGIIVTEKLLENYENDIHSFAEFIFLQLSKKQNNKINMYIGKTVDELLLLRESYDSALFSYSIRFYKKNCNVIYYDEIKDVSLNSDFNEKLNFDNLVEAIENNSTEGIEEIINSYFIEGNSNPADLKILHLKINYFVYQIIRLISKMNGDTTEILKYSLKLNFDNFIDFDDIMDSIKVFSEHCAKFMNNLRQNQSVGILYNVERYIHENYYKRITIKEVANHFYINSAYLGQIFKKKYGVFFIDYLHQYRMTKAKELLKHTDFKIYEISEKLGYKCPDNFIEKFEKINGTTPLQYRRIVNT
jgi:two-component system response regulator YesN